MTFLRWTGILLGASAFTLLTSTAILFAQDAHVWMEGRAYVTMEPHEDGALVTFLNGSVHADGLETFTLTVGDIVVLFEADVGHGTRPDTLRVLEVPEGYVAIPREITVAELRRDTLRIVPLSSLELM